MNKIIQATYNNGSLILQEKLADDWEGKVLQVVILESNEVEIKRQRFWEFVDSCSFCLPDNYQFNRAELYER